MTQTEMTDWLRDMAEGPMAHNPEHTDTCNMLTAVRVELERLQARLAALAKQCTDLESDREYNAELVKERDGEIERLRAIVDRQRFLLSEVYDQCGNHREPQRRHVLTPALRDAIFDELNSVSEAAEEARKDT